jgi:hypothetical protein
VLCDRDEVHHRRLVLRHQRWRARHLLHERDAVRGHEHSLHRGLLSELRYRCRAALLCGEHVHSDQPLLLQHWDLPVVWRSRSDLLPRNGLP